MTVKYLPGADGMVRVIESFTEIDGNVGPIHVQYKQRLTAHAGAEPASFHAVAEQNGSPVEVQGRYTAGTWWVTILDGGRSRSFDAPANRITMSTADLFDPETRVPLSRFQALRMLSAESGDVLEGAVADLGSTEVRMAGKNIPVTQFGWDGPQGRSEFAYSADGYLVQYKMKLMGLNIEGTLRGEPPLGLDEFPVPVGRPAIEVIDL
jgi:hypothetical protein